MVTKKRNLVLSWGEKTKCYRVQGVIWKSWAGQGGFQSQIGPEQRGGFHGRLRSPDQPDQKAGARREEEVGSPDWGTRDMTVSET